jgi:hypothetical protein
MGKVVQFLSFALVMWCAFQLLDLVVGGSNMLCTISSILSDFAGLL